MDRLPSDILCEIFDLLDPNWDDHQSPSHWVRSPKRHYLNSDNRRDMSDIARLRLVCKKFSSLGAQYMFRCVVQRFSRKSFRRLECLAEHPELGHYVKKFVYLMPYLYIEGSKGFTKFKQEGPRLCRDLETRMIFEDEQYLFPQIYAEQQDIIQSSYDLCVLEKAMRAFKNLQAITILQTAGHLDLTLRRLSYSISFGPRGWDYPYCCWVPACQRVAETLIYTLHGTGSQIRSFVCPMISPQALMRVDPQIQHTALSSLWQNLTSLELSFDDSEFFVNWRDADHSGRVKNLDENVRLLSKTFLNRLFHAAEHLSAVYLGFDYQRPIDVPLEQVFDEVTWPRLKTFGIESWRLSAKEIVDFVRRHRRTLKGLRLGNILLREGDLWREVVIALRRYCRELRSVSLDGCGYEKGFNERKEQAQQIGNVLGVGNLTDLSVALGIEVSDSSDDETDEWEEEGQDGDEDEDDFDDHQERGHGQTGNSSRTILDLIDIDGYGWMNAADDETILTDNGLTVTQDQRRLWEKWITSSGVLSTCFWQDTISGNEKHQTEKRNDGSW